MDACVGSGPSVDSCGPCVDSCGPCADSCGPRAASSSARTVLAKRFGLGLGRGSRGCGRRTSARALCGARWRVGPRDGHAPYAPWFGPCAFAAQLDDDDAAAVRKLCAASRCAAPLSAFKALDSSCRTQSWSVGGGTSKPKRIAMARWREAGAPGLSVKLNARRRCEVF